MSERSEPIPEEQLPTTISDNLGALKRYVAETDEGSVVILPIVADDGESVRFDARIHLEGVAGPLPVSERTLERINAPEDWLQKIRLVVDELSAAFPQMESISDQLELPEGFASEEIEPAALPAGEEVVEEPGA